MPRQYTRNPGADQVAKWKQALADHHRQQRQRRGRRNRGGVSTRYRVGMARIEPSKITDNVDNINNSD